MKKLPLFLLMLCIPLLSQAQWINIGMFNQVVSDMIVHENKIWFGGNFTKFNGSTCYWSAAWDGTGMARHTTLIGGTGINTFGVHKNELYAAESMHGNFSLGVSKWNGSSWDSDNYFKTSHSAIFSDGDTLFVGDNIKGQLSYKTSATSWAPFSAAFGSNANINCIIKFNGQLIVAGAFDSINGQLINSIAAWNGTSWEPLGTVAQKGVNGSIYKLLVFKGELYAAGNFETAGGHAAICIAKWNGISWSSVGGSLPGNSWNGIRDMAADDNFLYAAGDFNSIGGVSAKYLARWDGSSWSSAGYKEPGLFIQSVEIWNNALYVVPFSFDSSFVYTTDLTTGFDKFTNNFSVSVYPNPAYHELNVEFVHSLDGILNYEVLSMTGQLLTNGSWEGLTRSINTSSLKPGMYVLRIRNMNGIGKVVKFVKE